MMPKRLMYLAVILISTAFAILRNLRNTLAVTDLGGHALSIPYFELLGALPASALLSVALGCMLRRYSFQLTFSTTVFLFLLFFVLFTFFAYPFAHHLDDISRQFLSASFFVMAELWKVALLTVLFWGLLNQNIPLADAKELYAPLMLASSLGTLVAGAVTTWAAGSSDYIAFYDDPWRQTLTILIAVVVLLGVISVLLYGRIASHLGSSVQYNSISYSASLISLPSKLLALMVIADYIAYTLGEVIFLDALKQYCPKSQDYCIAMGHLSLWCGLLTVVSALWIAPGILQRYSWEIAALATPIALLITEGVFFLFLRLPNQCQLILGWEPMQWLQVVVWLGSFQYCLCRALKYTLFDSSKEIAFVMMSQDERMSGKLLIDGFCARLGRGSASGISLFLAHLTGGAIASAWLAAPIAMSACGVWIASTYRLRNELVRGQLYE